MREKEIFVNALNQVKEVCFETEAEKAELDLIFCSCPYEVTAFDNKSLGPDIMIKTESFIYALEHFEVDGSVNNDKGSLYKREQHHKSVASDRFVNTQVEELGDGVAIIKGEFQSKFTYKNFFNNFKKHFIRHYKKIDNYHHNLRSIDKDKYDFYFLVEDSTPIHSFVDDVEGITPNVLLNDVHVYNIIQSCKHIKGVFFLQHLCINGRTTAHLSFLLNTPENIAERKKLREHKLFDGYKATQEMDTLKYIDIIIESDVE